MAAAWRSSTSCTAPTRSCACCSGGAARCINTTMMVTLLGAAVSDALENGQVVSGVGVIQLRRHGARAAGRALDRVRARHRTRHGHTTSNIIWNYAHQTIPRHTARSGGHTEYGIADLRGRTDEEIIIALLNVADSRFQTRCCHAPGRRARSAPTTASRRRSATTCRSV